MNIQQGFRQYLRNYYFVKQLRWSGKNNTVTLMWIVVVYTEEEVKNQINNF